MRRLPDRSADDARSGGRLKAAVEHLRVKIYLSRPLDRAGLRVDVDLIEDLSVVANRSEDASPADQLAQVDLLDGTIREARADPEPIEGLDIGDADDLAHFSGSIGAGLSLLTARVPVAISILADSPLAGMEMWRWMIAEVHLDHDSEEAADAGHRASLASRLDGAKVSVGMAD